MQTTQALPGVGPEASDTREPSDERCDGCDGELVPTLMYAAVLRDREPDTARVRLCNECAHFVRGGTHEKYAGLYVLGNLIGRVIFFRRPIDESKDWGLVVRDIPEHNSVAIAPSEKGRFGRFERVIHRSNILHVETIPALLPVTPVVREVRYAS